MSKTEKKELSQSPAKSSRERLTERILSRFPDRRFESDEDVFDALDEYDSFLSEHYERMLGDHNRLTELMYSNPRVGAFIADVAEGEDALVACVRYFGEELLDKSTDAEKMQAIRRANDEYVERHRAYRELEEAMRGNVEKSARAIERFKQRKKMSEDELEEFMDRIFHMCQHVFVGDLNEDVLELLYKGLHYETDLSCAEHAAEIKGRNRRILLERRDAVGDRVSATPHRSSPKTESAGYRFARRHKSVWDM